jgi:pimeloyl-ACP methyl ester carboxylesterase
VEDRLDTRRVRFVEAAGVRTRVYEAGAGPTLVLLHGGLYGSLYSLDCFSLNLPSLERSFRVVAFDRLGQGHTAPPAGDGDYGYGPLLEHALAVVDALGVSNTAAPDDERFPRGAFYRELESRVPPGPPSRESVRMEPDEQSFSTGHVSDDFVARLLEIARLPTQQRALDRLRAVRDTVWEPSLDEARAGALAAIDEHGLPGPTLVIWGADDPSAPLPLAFALFERIAARTPETELHVLARAGHYSFREQPAAFERLVGAFCSGR